MRRAVPVLAAALALSACVYPHQRFAACAERIPTQAAAWAELTGGEAGRPVTATFKLCGRGSRMAALEAEAAGLQAQGFSVAKSRAEEVNHCWRAAKAIARGAESIRPQLEAMCAAADRAGGLFASWSAVAGGRSLIGTSRSVSVTPLIL